MNRNKPKLIRITTVPISLEKLLEGQLTFMQQFYEVTAISAEKEKLQEFGKANNVATYFIELTRKITPLQDLKAVYKLYKFLKKEKPLIVHTHTPKAGIVGMLAAYLAKVPLRLHTVAGLPLMEATGFKRKILNFVEKSTYRFSTNVYPNSKGLYDFITSEGFTAPKKLQIIGAGSSNGIDTSYFDPALFTTEAKQQKRNEIGIPQNNFVFVFVGRLVKDKGINELVTAFSKLSSENTNVSLLLVGPLEADLDPLAPETLIEINNLKNIYSIGYQNDVRPFFALSDALVFPSYREGFPNVVLQAGAMGLPAIVSDINGCNEIVSENNNGCIIPVKNAEAIFTAMKNLVNTKPLYETLKENARPVITSKYERKEIWEHLLREYRRLEAKL
ncbi:glycosyltransferase family 4 protein [Ulvibacter litoralis]|uniref:Glycosyltransferase involved in cell wall bisynthesis n=1 Tax=Ulvibacter litoralis TaxID=227084 RepID=A0A1G7HNM5_9FLAO|nr:glycosyltransferase family 4 protein [Ulvibacter litoralis]GHC58490.1 glycosyl transferase [Ulvibacter litoralis]SDF02055.1 Glycosyltransferase involved in cell wall bisynthesis [Ulvibacter litoralis]